MDFDLAVEVLRSAFEKGVTYVDTAPGYRNRESEIAVGRALCGWRDKIILVTKASREFIKKPGDVRRMLEHQLFRLDTDHIDFYLFHHLTWSCFHEKQEATGWLEDVLRAKDEGLSGHMGFSFHDEPQRMIDLIDMGWAELVLCQYNYLDPRNADSIAYAASKGVGTVVMGPVGGGRLSVIPKSIRESNLISENQAATLALRYVVSNPNVNVALSGMGSLAMVEESVSAVEKGSLSEQELDVLNRLLEESRALADLYCTGCGHCMPCPNGVNIPRNFEISNYFKVYGLEDYALQQYGRMVSGKQDAAKCIECGTCMDLCPQNVQIIDQLKEVVDLLAR